MANTSTITPTEAVHNAIDRGIADARADRSQDGAEALNELRDYAERLKRERDAKAGR